MKTMIVDGQPTLLQLWDTAGQERCVFLLFQRVVSCVLSDFQTVSIELCVFNAISSAK